MPSNSGQEHKRYIEVEQIEDARNLMDYKHKWYLFFDHTEARSKNNYYLISLNRDLLMLFLLLYFQFGPSTI